jgi:hypothetical protein
MVGFGVLAAVGVVGLVLVGAIILFGSIFGWGDDGSTPCKSFGTGGLSAAAA